MTFFAHVDYALQLSDVIVRTTGDFYWGADASTLYYTTQVCTLCTCSSYCYDYAHTQSECIAYSAPTHSRNACDIKHAVASARPVSAVAVLLCHNRMKS
jgi:hypothetical protein